MSATLVVEINEIIQDNGQLDIQILHYTLKHTNATKSELNWLDVLDDGVANYIKYVSNKIEESRQKKFDANETGE